MPNSICHLRQNYSSEQYNLCGFTHVFMLKESIGAGNNSKIGDKPNEEIISGCIKYLCSLFQTKDTSTLPSISPESIRWHLFCRQTPDQGVENLPPTEGAWRQHILRAHLQAHVWEQDLVLHPTRLDPTQLGWGRSNENELRPKPSELPPAPTSLIELVRCSRGRSKGTVADGVCSTRRFT